MAVTKGVKQLWKEAMAEVTTVEAADAVALQDNDDYVFLDIRDVRELGREGVIPGALHTPRGMLEYWVDPESPYYKDIFGKDKTFVLF